MTYDVLTVKEVSEILKISLPSTYTLFKRRDFPAVSCAARNALRVNREAFDKWLSGENKKRY